MSSDLQDQAKRHLWMHFTRMGSYASAEVPVIVRGEGCYVYDEHGKRYLDGLSALYCVNIGHGRAEMGQAAPTTSSRGGEGRDRRWAADAMEGGILSRARDRVAAVILEPVQNGGGCFVPQEGYFQRVREICDRHGVLLISDEVICSWGRLGHWFGSERYDIRPDMITTAKGITSAYAPMGALITSDKIA